MRDKIISGTLWSSFNLVVSRGLQFVVYLILARLLLPEHFGIVGMAVVFTSVISVLGEMGLSAALIRSRDDEISETHFHTAFWASIAFNLLIYLIIALGLAPFAAWFYEEDILRLVLPVLGLSVLIMPFSLIPRIILTRNLNFKRLNLIQIVPTIISGIIAVTMALMGFGVWSIVAHGVTAAAFTVPVFWLSVSWRPKLVFSKQALKQILGFGVYDTLQNTFISLTNNVDYFIIGKLLGATSLGIYTLAYVLTSTIRQQLTAVLNKVMFPIFGIIQADRLLVKRYYLNVVKYNTVVIFPVVLVLMIYSEPIILNLFGEKWYDAITPTRLLCIASLINAMGGSPNTVMRALGRIKPVVFIVTVNTTFVFIPAIIIGIKFFGVNGAAMAFILQIVVARVAFFYHLNKEIKLNLFEYMKSFKPALLGSSIIISIGLFYVFLGDTSSFLFDLIFIIGSIVLYAIILLFILKKEFKNDFNTSD